MSAAHLMEPPPPGRPVVPEESRWIDHPSGFLALSPRNRRFSADGLPGFIAYREQGGHLFALGGVHGPVEARGALLDRFLGEAARRRRRVVAVQVRLDQADLFRALGFTVNQLGCSYGLCLRDFRLGGGARVKLRNKLRRARASGLRVVELGRDRLRDEAAFAGLRAISDHWLRDKGKKELDFMIGELGGPAEALRRVFVVEGAAGPVGFITYVPVWGARPGYLHDLTRRLPDAPPGAMELCNAVALERLVAEGVAHLHFGFTPFVTLGEEGPGHSPRLRWILGQLYRRGGFVYPAQSQVAYKQKWAPDIIEPELVACRPLSLRAILDLLLLTRSI